MYIFIYVTAASDYVVTAFGSICSDIGKIPVVDENECQRAATPLGKFFILAQEDAVYPRGCYFLGNGDTFWNSHENGTYRSDCAEICRKIGNNF